MVVMTVSIRDSLTNAKARHANAACDEYYTGEALAHRLIDHCEAIGARKLVLPCDTDTSRIAIYARERAAAGAFDDVAVFNDFEMALDTVDESYHIVTNPPFSKLARMIYPRVVDWEGGFTLVVPLTSVKYEALRDAVVSKRVFFSNPPKAEKSFDVLGGGQKCINNAIIASTARSSFMPLHDAVPVPPDGMPFSDGGLRVSTVRLPEYPYDTENDVLLPLSSCYYDVPGFEMIRISHDHHDETRINGKELFSKIIWRYRHDDV